MKTEIEICCGSYYDAYQAYLGGAKRIELNSALHMGGLTPSVGALRLTKQNTDLEVVTMVRPRGGGFCYQKEDFEQMIADCVLMLENGADGIAFGCLDKNGNIELKQTKVIVDIIHQAGKEAIFHRAFDCVNDPFVAMKALISLGVDRVLTSGLQPKAIAGKKVIKQLQEMFGDQIEILAGSGINATNAKTLIEETGIYQVHSSCKDWLVDPTTSLTAVSYAFDEVHPHGYDVVDQSLVKAIIASLDDGSI